MVIKKSVLRIGVLVALAVFAGLAGLALSAQPAAAGGCGGTFPFDGSILGEDSCTITYTWEGLFCDATIRCKTGACTTVYKAVPPPYTDSGVRELALPEQVSHTCKTEPTACGLWVPDVGDAHEKGLIGTDAPEGAQILIATEPDLDHVVSVISFPYVGTDTFQVPEQYRSEEYWFKADVCGRWHGGQELELGSTE